MKRIFDWCPWQEAKGDQEAISALSTKKLKKRKQNCFDLKALFC